MSTPDNAERALALDPHVDQAVMQRRDVPEPFRTLIAAAILAPSGDNTQPATFEVDVHASTIIVGLNASRDPSPMNAGQRMARIACGAAIENIVQAAGYNGWSAKVSIRRGHQQLAAIAVDGASCGPGTIEPAMSARCTNRRHYDKAPAPPEIVTGLVQSVAADDRVPIAWITDGEDLGRWARRIGAADAAMFGQREFLAAFLANVRFDLEPNATADEGLPVGSLELGRPEQLLLPRLEAIARWKLAALMLRRSFASKAASLVQSSSGLCVINSQSLQPPERPLVIGRSLQRAWLHLARQGFSVQPMMSLPVLHNYAGYYPDAAFSRAISSQPWFGGSDEHSDVGAPAAILRFGYAAEPTARTGRRPLPAALSNAETMDAILN